MNVISEQKQAEFNLVQKAKRDSCTSLHKCKRDQDLLLLKYHQSLQHHQNSHLDQCVSWTIRVILVLSPTLLILF